MSEWETFFGVFSFAVQYFIWNKMLLSIFISFYIITTRHPGVRIKTIELNWTVSENSI